jgi:hypothetical protein
MWKIVACCEICAYIFALLQRSSTAVCSNMLQCVEYGEIILNASEWTSTGDVRIPISGWNEWHDSHKNYSDWYGICWVLCDATAETMDGCTTLYPGEWKLDL